MHRGSHIRDKDQEKFRLKRLLKKLQKKEGRGTELISLYIPPSRRISEVIRYLRQEYSTSSNIKSDITRKNVQNAIVKVMERLKLFKEAPETGLAIFCGAIPQNGPGSEKMEIYVIIPPEPINLSLYRCDSRFYLEPLEELIKEREAYGIVSIDINEAAIGILDGSNIHIISKRTSGIPGKHRAGGQSARRFERLREAEINEYFKRIAKYVNQTFLNPEYEQKLVGVLIGGPGFTKEEFAESKYIDYRIKEKIIGFINTNYSGEEGIREIVEKAKNYLKETKYLREKSLVDELLRQISSKNGLVTYGLKNVWNAVQNGNVKTVLISDNFKGYVLVEKCNTCGFHRETVFNDRPKTLAEERCPVCNKGFLQKEIVEIIDYLDEKSDEYNYVFKVISSNTEYGKIFNRLSGIAAFLKYKEY